MPALIDLQVVVGICPVIVVTATPDSQRLQSLAIPHSHVDENVTGGPFADRALSFQLFVAKAVNCLKYVRMHLS